MAVNERKERTRLRSGALPHLPLLALLAACDVPAPEGATGGVDVGSSACGAGIVVASSDYVSTSVGLLGVDGKVTSGAILSSGAQVAGLSTSLSGDLVLPTAAPASGKVVLLDRYPNAVITWVDPVSGGVSGQLAVATGFGSNPQDYLEISATKAYVSRYNRNPAPGAMPFDRGGDILVIDPQAREIRSSIDFEEMAPFQPRPSRMIAVGSAIWLSLGRLDDTFTKAEDGRLVGIDPATDKLRWSLDLPGLSNCYALAYQEKSALVALACSGVSADAAHQLDHAAVVLLDTSHEPPTEKLRVTGATLGDPPPPGGPSALVFADERRLLVTLSGSIDAGRPDRLLALSTADGTFQEIYRATTAFVLGDLACTTACTGRCFLTDAEASGLRSFAVTAEGISDSGVTTIPEARGLPPRNLGIFGGKKPE